MEKKRIKISLAKGYKEIAGEALKIINEFEAFDKEDAIELKKYNSQEKDAVLFDNYCNRRKLQKRKQ
jgi:hypothetical protein